MSCSTRKRRRWRGRPAIGTRYGFDPHEHLIWGPLIIALPRDACHLHVGLDIGSHAVESSKSIRTGKGAVQEKHVCAFGKYI